MRVKNEPYFPLKDWTLSVVFLLFEKVLQLNARLRHLDSKYVHFIIYGMLAQT